jgi:hypothetical protein
MRQSKIAFFGGNAARGFYCGRQRRRVAQRPPESDRKTESDGILGCEAMRPISGH